MISVRLTVLNIIIIIIIIIINIIIIIGSSIVTYVVYDIRMYLLFIFAEIAEISRGALAASGRQRETLVAP